MLARLVRLLRAIVGFFITKAEDPELILQQTIRDMRDKVPHMQENVALVMSNQKMLERQVSNLEHEIVDYDAKIKAAISSGRDDIARTYISALNEKKSQLEVNTKQLDTARQASAQAKKFFDSYILQVKKRTAEAQQLVSEARAAKMQEELSSAMASFQIGDVSDTFSEMGDRIHQRAARAEARMDIATNNIDVKMQEIESEMLHAGVEDSLNAYKRSMGLDTSPAAASAAGREPIRDLE